MTQPASLLLESRPLPLRVSVAPAEPASRGHAVQFYEHEQFLYAAVADYVAAGLMADESVIVIATPSHSDGIALRLRARGIDLAAAAARGQYLALDAREILATFMVGARPDTVRFHAAIGAVVERSRGATAGGVVRIFGEMVDALWKDGNTEGALQLEDLWNQFVCVQPVTLLCAYALGNFVKEVDSASFQQICHAHHQITPAESYAELDERDRAAAISLLQQRARALETEITHRDELERRLRAALAERRSAEEAEQAARLEAEAANRAKSAIMAVVSHELRTPLGAIGGYVELMQLGMHGPLTDDQRSDLDRIQRSQKLLLRVINDMLSLTQLESGRLDLQWSDVVIDDVLVGAMDMMTSLAQAKEVRCEYRRCDASILVRADRERLGQIVINLLGNALKFTSAGGVVTLECVADAATVAVRVSDTGRGIPMDKLERIFEPFARVAGDGPAAIEGIGLGLAISRGLARDMGGDIAVTSAVGVGSVFTVTLPRLQGEAGA